MNGYYISTSETNSIKLIIISPRRDLHFIKKRIEVSPGFLFFLCFTGCLSGHSQVFSLSELAGCPQQVSGQFGLGIWPQQRALRTKAATRSGQSCLAQCQEVERIVTADCCC